MLNLLKILIQYQVKYSFFILLLLPMSSAISEEISFNETPALIHVGFHTGSSYRKLTHYEKSAYATGLIDGLLLAPAFEAPKEKLKWIEVCLRKMDSEQVTMILDKFINENPAKWQSPMNMLAMNAFVVACE